jgi:isopentenyl-diphosphate delta-isomerase type 1
MNDEYFDIVDENNQIVGRASRSECHGNPSLIHRAVHVLVFHPDGRLFLQKRSTSKDVQPGKWDTSVGGHLGSGESYLQAASREMKEELGINKAELTYLYDYSFRNSLESENIRSYKIIYDGHILIDPEEIDDGRFYSLEEIESRLNTDFFTPNFKEEIRHYYQWLKKSNQNDF